MKIEEWKVSGYRSIHEERFSCSKFNVLIGKNNSGKSNVLDSILDYRDILNDDIDLSSWYSDRLIRNNNVDEIAFEATFGLSDESRSSLIEELTERDVFGESQAEDFRDSDTFSKIQHEIHLSEGGITEEVFRTNIKGSMEDLSREGNRTRENDVLVLENLPAVTYTSAKYRVDKSFLDTLQNSLSNWQTLRATRNPKGMMDLIRRNKIDEAGEKLAQVLGTLSMNSPETFQEISESYQSIMEGVSEVDVQLLEEGNVTVEVLGEGFTDSFVLDEISAGSQQILILLTAIIRAKENSEVLFVEEPEQHLHPGAEQHVYDLIEEISLSGTQVFVTTHSDVFVNETGTENIMSVYRNEENVTELETVEGTEIDSTLSMLGYEKSDFYQSSAVVFVEDQSDRVVFKQLADTLGYPLKERGIRLISLEGDNMFADAEPMLKIIRQLRMPYLFILDSDKMDPEEKTKSVASDLGVSPENVYVLKKPVIESYLIESAEPIARAFNIQDLEVVEEFLDGAGKRNHAKTLNRICKEELDQSMSKKAINGIVSRHMERGEIPGELDQLLRRVRDMPSES
ncbi:AAA family ATPase [Haloterrigena salinisoli]|uniref:ATP-dependent nuclease n=1 Tax=Haloterrigena salinisoli TaxID=3132747 RepID=UPI0030CD6441